MDFYRQQTLGHGRSTLLITVYFAGILTLAFIASAWLTLFLSPFLLGGASLTHPPVSRYLSFFLTLATIIFFCSLAISYLQYRQLLAGGWQIAKALGGRRLLSSSNEPLEKRGCNIVDEMAIASGMPVPALYVLDNEEGINGFAAGMSTSDAVIVITHGALQALDRDELQAVIAHEFSHIHNGDMRINMYLSAALGGLLFIEQMMEKLEQLSDSHRHEHKSGVIAGAGRTLGYGGVFFSELLKAAVNRQREALADAYAVQFTRHPLALANALKKVAGHPYASLILHPLASQFSHLFFSQGQNRSFSGPLATHPPLRERILALEPDWDGMYIRGGITNWFASQQGVDDKPVERRQQEKQLQDAELDHLDLDAPDGWLHKLPVEQLDAARSIHEAPLLVYSLLLSPDISPRHKQLQSLPEKERVDELSRHDLPRKLRLALLELAISTLTQMPPEHYPAFREKIHELIMADNEQSQFEWALYHLLTHQLDTCFYTKQVLGAKIRDIQQLVGPITTLCCGFSRLCQRDEKRQHHFFQSIADVLKLPLCWPTQYPTWEAMDTALTSMQSAAPGIQLRFVQALSCAMESDGVISDEEFELFRVIAITLDCPLPPPQAGRATPDENK